MKSQRRSSKRKLQQDVIMAPDYFEVLKESSETARINNVDVINLNQSQGAFMGFCHVASFLPLTRVSSQNEIQSSLVDLMGLASILLAVRHLNTGDGSIVKELKGINKRCNIRFTTEFFDTEYMEFPAVSRLLQVLKRNDDENKPCAFIGALRSSVSMAMAINTGAAGYPQISHFSTANVLDDKNQYKLFGRVIPCDHATAIPIIIYFRDKLNVKHLAILHTDDNYGYEFATSLQDSAKSYAKDMVLQTFDISYHNPTPIEIKDSIRSLASTKYRYFFSIITDDIYDILMTEAFDQGIAGPDFTWIFSDSLSFSTFTNRKFEENSPLAIASIGTSVFAATGGIPGLSQHDAFTKSWLALKNDEDIKYIESKIPKREGFDFIPLRDLFNHSDLSEAALLYDATIGIGLGACNYSMKYGDIFSGKEHYSSIVQSSFMGASGNVSFDASTGTRQAASAIFRLTNFQKDAATKGNFTLLPKTVELFQNHEWIHISPYIFADGTNNIPVDLPPVQINYNYINTPLRVIGILMFLIILASSGFSAYWTYIHRKSKVIIASQPIFLYIISFGAFLMGSAIIPLSIDDQIASVNVCNICCNTSPWLFCIGFELAFGSLFSKTWRLNKIFNNPTLKRVQVKALDVIRPMCILLSANVLFLALWVILAPSEWLRQITSFDLFGRAVNSVGYCSSTFYLQFLSVLIAINAGAMGLALYQAYKGRHIQTELGDTKYIVLTIGSMFIVFSMGVPVWIMVKDNPKAVYFVRIFIIFVVCTSLILFTFYPKVIFYREVELGHISLANVVRETLTIASAHSKRRSILGSRGSKNRDSLSVKSFYNFIKSSRNFSSSSKASTVASCPNYRNES